MVEAANSHNESFERLSMAQGARAVLILIVGKEDFPCATRECYRRDDLQIGKVEMGMGPGAYLALKGVSEGHIFLFRDK